MTMIPRNVARNRLGTGALQQMQQTPGLVFVPPPVGGWNARDAWAVMPETDAPLLDNFVIDGGALKVRPGHENWSDDLTGSSFTPTLHVYASGSTTKLIAIGGDTWDVTSSGAPTTISTTGMLNAISTMAFGTLVLAGDGTGVYTYDGSSLSAASIAGATAADLRYPLLFKSRMFFYEINTLSFWYNGTLQAVDGTYTEFDLSQVATRGGELSAIMRISLQDQGAGSDDVFAALTSEGELIVYQGSDPGDASNWSLIGVYFISEPVNATGSSITRTRTATVGNNVFLATRAGYTSIAAAITNPLDINTATISAKILRELQSLFSDPPSDAVFKAEYDPRHNWLWFVATRAGTSDEVHVYDLNNGAWYRFYTIFSIKDLRYYNGDMYVIRESAATTFDVRVFSDAYYDDNGTAITCEWMTAPTFAGSPLVEKRFTGVELEASSDGALTSIEITTAGNFEPPDRATLTTENPGTPGSWSLYDYDATEWADNRPIGRLYKKGCDVMGRSAMARVSLSVRNRPDLRIHGLRWQFEPAAPGAAASY